MGTFFQPNNERYVLGLNFKRPLSHFLGRESVWSDPCRICLRKNSFWATPVAPKLIPTDKRCVWELTLVRPMSHLLGVAKKCVQMPLREKITPQRYLHAFVAIFRVSKPPKKCGLSFLISCVLMGILRKKSDMGQIYFLRCTGFTMVSVSETEFLIKSRKITNIVLPLVNAQKHFKNKSS